MDFKYRYYLLFIVVSLLSCKNTAQNTDKSELFAEIANKTWVYIDENSKESYKEILEYSDKGESANIITKSNSISLTIDEQIPFKNYHIDSVKKTNNGYFILTDSKISINFSWIDKNKNISKWNIIIPHYYDTNDNFNEERITVNREFATPKNFPILKKEEKVEIEKEEEKPLNNNLYSGVLEKLPLEGQFSCDYKEEGRDYIFKGGKLFLSNKNNTDSEGRLKEKALARITFTDYLTVECEVRKVNTSKNKYALFYKGFINTKFSVSESTYYSKVQPIAEIEIINNNTIRKKWLGFYNRRTKQIENAEDIGWQDEYCDIIKRIN